MSQNGTGGTQIEHTIGDGLPFMHVRYALRLYLHSLLEHSGNALFFIAGFVKR